MLRQGEAEVEGEDACPVQWSVREVEQRRVEKLVKLKLQKRKQQQRILRRNTRIMF